MLVVSLARIRVGRPRVWRSFLAKFIFALTAVAPILAMDRSYPVNFVSQQREDSRTASFLPLPQLCIMNSRH